MTGVQTCALPISITVDVLSVLICTVDPMVVSNAPPASVVSDTAIRLSTSEKPRRRVAVAGVTSANMIRSAVVCLKHNGPKTKQNAARSPRSSQLLLAALELPTLQSKAERISVVASNDLLSRVAPTPTKIGRDSDVSNRELHECKVSVKM